MLVQYAFHIKEKTRDTDFHQFLKLISRERANKIEKYYFEADKVRSLYAEVLLRYGLQKIGMKQGEILFSYNEYGKPELANQEQIHFNVSHSGDWVVCGISSHPVGVDVEQVKDRELNLAERFFSKREYEQICIAEKKKQAELFFEFWTLKESYVKALGMGMYQSFESFGFQIGDDKLELYTDNNLCKKYEFLVYSIAEEYKAAICTFSGEQPGKYQLITVEELRKILL